MTASLTMGVEEEYLLVDPDTRDLAKNPPRELMDKCREELGGQVSPEFLRCQIEIGTPVCADIKEARRHLATLRGAIIRNAREHGLAVIAASTHPFGQWGQQQYTPSERYAKLDADLQGAIRRMLVCGMHVHIGIEEEDLRIDVMNQVRYFLPHLLALSASSPFWSGHEMGMKSYRLCVWYGMPRTGLPDAFDSWGEYQRFISRLIEAGVIEDGTKIWWDLRPSARYPTLELRVPDVCTFLEDALSIAALYQSLVRHLALLRRKNLRWRIYPMALVRENRWLAQRYGVGGRLLDLGKSAQVPFAALLEEIIDLVADDAKALGCYEEVCNARNIVERGSSADRQLKAYHQARALGADDREALQRVVDVLIEETAADVPGI